MKFSAIVFTAITALTSPALAKPAGLESENRASTTRHDADLLDAALKLTSFNPSFVKPDTEIDVISTLGGLYTLNQRFNREIRAEVVDGRHILIHHPTTSHVSTLASDALQYAQEKLQSGAYPANTTETDGALEARQGSCVHNVCVIVAQCGANCALCYPIFCI